MTVVQSYQGLRVLRELLKNRYYIEAFFFVVCYVGPTDHSYEFWRLQLGEDSPSTCIVQFALNWLFNCCCQFPHSFAHTLQTEHCYILALLPERLFLDNRKG